MHSFDNQKWQYIFTLIGSVLHIYDIFVEICSLHISVWCHLDFVTGICLRYITNKSYEEFFLNWPITYVNKVDSMFKFTLYVYDVSVHLGENSWAPFY